MSDDEIRLMREEAASGQSATARLFVELADEALARGAEIVRLKGLYGNLLRGKQIEKLKDENARLQEEVDIIVKDIIIQLKQELEDERGRCWEGWRRNEFRSRLVDICCERIGYLERSFQKKQIAEAPVVEVKAGK